MARCSICGSEPFDKSEPMELGLTHLPIYVDGSEGVEICFACKIAVTEFLRTIKQACARARVAMAKERKELFKSSR